MSYQVCVTVCHTDNKFRNHTNANCLLNWIESTAVLSLHVRLHQIAAFCSRFEQYTNYSIISAIFIFVFYQVWLPIRPGTFQYDGTPHMHTQNIVPSSIAKSTSIALGALHRLRPPTRGCVVYTLMRSPSGSRSEKVKHPFGGIVCSYAVSVWFSLCNHSNCYKCQNPPRMSYYYNLQKFKQCI